MGIDLGYSNTNYIPLDKRNSISLLLGAGFSVPMGYPTAYALADKLLHIDNENIRFSSSGQLAIYPKQTKQNSIGDKSDYIIRKTKCFRPAKRNVQKAKRNVFVLDTLPNHIKNSVRTAFLPNSNAISILLISVYPITTSRLSISANFKPQSLAALKSSFSSTASMATSTSALARSEKYFSVFCF